MQYGLFGEDLSHSYSKIIHEKFGLYNYELHSGSLRELESMLKSRIFEGLNITIPYKRSALHYCDKLDIIAKRVGSVNTVVNKNGILTGYNTDYFGLKYTINRSKISLKNKKVIILGSGGTSATARALAEDLQAKQTLVVSRTGTLNYKTVYTHTDAEIIINTTPVGMYPNNGDNLVDISNFKNLCGLVDVVYNPFCTDLLAQGKKYNIPTASGLPMLVEQAKISAELFKNTKLDDSVSERIIKELTLELSNIILIGMPGSGKTTIGKLIAEKLGKKFIDIDEKVEDLYQITIPEIFNKYGEKTFRKREKSVIYECGKKNNCVISTGGGAILDSDNYLPLKQNGRIYWIERGLEILETKGRPLSDTLKKLEKMYHIRKDLYRNFSDMIIQNNGAAHEAVRKILEDFYENTSC